MPVLGTLLYAPGAAAGSEKPAGTILIRLLEAPVNRQADPRAHTYIIDHLAPGTVIHRGLEVANTSDTVQHVELYAGAATVGNGTFTFAPDHTTNELTGWVRLDGTGREVPAHGSVRVEATITVPRTASRGERYAVIWASDSGASDAAASVRMVNRVGVRVYLDVGPGGEPPSDFRIDNVTAARTADGTPEVLAKVRNTGGRALDMSGSLELTDSPGFFNAGPFPANRGTTLAVNETEAITVPVDKNLPDGPWTADLTLASGLVQHAVTDRLTFPHAAGTSGPIKPLPADSLTPLLERVAAAAVATSVVLVGSVAYRRGRRRPARTP
ncbi:peptidase [Streptacidiphilus sp. EB129]|uniref:peptidase n=1 Tax=Streptacidiphilus sp. EB129 TaxID=3156262 RepID=UPI003511A4A5